MRSDVVLTFLCLMKCSVVSGEDFLPKGDELLRGAPRLKLQKPRISMSALNEINSLMPPIPSEWPPNFSIFFISNLTSAEKMEAASMVQAVKGIFSFSDSVGVQISHGPGNSECLMAFGTRSGCSLHVEGRKFYVQYAANYEQVCCLSKQDYSVVRRDWPVLHFEYNATRRVMGRMCHGFRRDARSSTESFTYWADSETKLPCAVSFDNEPGLDWYFVPGSVKLEKEYLSPSFADSAKCDRPCPSRAPRSAGLWISL